MSAWRDSRERAIIVDLQARLRAELGDPRLAVEGLTAFGDGHSGHTYRLDLVTDGAVRPAVLRLSPPGRRIAGPADVGRQGRIMTALGAAGLPVPWIIACDSAPAIERRAFALMELVDGEPWSAVAARRSHHYVAELALEVLSRVHALPISASGIAEERPTTPDEELARWARLLDRAPVAARMAGAPLRERLAATLPPAATPALVHGDFHYGNLLFAEDRVAAVVDWELAQLGEPLLDVGCLAVASMRARYTPEPNPTGSVEIAIPELVEAYGADPQRAAWFIALSCFKYGAIIGFNLELHRSGKRPDPIYDLLQGTMYGLLEDGVAIVRDGLDGAVPEAPSERCPAPARHGETTDGD